MPIVELRSVIGLIFETYLGIIVPNKVKKVTNARMKFARISPQIIHAYMDRFGFRIILVCVQA